VYTIGVGTKGQGPLARSPLPDRPVSGTKYVDVQIDEATLMNIADRTGGKYFRATDEGKLKDIYGEIDRLEKTRIKVTEHRAKNEEYFPFLFLGCALLVTGFILDRSILHHLA
jgi:Ca-activated chloride channel family protein